MYPRSTGAGCKASHMVTGICKLAGIQDIGVKVIFTPARTKRREYAWVPVAVDDSPCLLR